MVKLFGAISTAVALFTAVRAIPLPEFTEDILDKELWARNTLGSSFGVPGNATYDYVVVGAGNAGMVVAYRLAAAGHTVALVEAGTFYELTNGNKSEIPAMDTWFAGKNVDDTNNEVDWNFVTTPQAGAYGRASHYARGKCLGGNTARNYMTYHLPTKGSMQNWADAVGDQSYAYSSFVNYYMKSMYFTKPNMNVRFANTTPQYDTSTLGTSGLVSYTFPNYAGAFGTYAMTGLAQLGMPQINGFTSGNLIGASYSLATVNQALGTRASSSTAFLESALGLSVLAGNIAQPFLNLQVYTLTMAKKILFSGTQAIGVQVNSEGEVYNLMANKEVIVSAGSFQSPQLLMVSGIGPAATLIANGIPVLVNSPGVGQNMQDHILFGPSYRMNFVTNSQLALPAGQVAQRANFYKSPAQGLYTNCGQDVLGWEKIPNSVANYSATANATLSAYPADWPQIEILNVNGFFGYQNNFHADAPTDGYNYATIATALVAPRSRGNVTIVSSDTSVLPVINPNWLTDSTDVEVAVAAFKRARMLFNSQAVSPMLIGPEYFPGPSVQTDAQILDIIRKSFNTVFHAACTCSMGPSSNPNSVIDAQARVYGVTNLRVVDASSMPFIPPGHPMSTIYALAEKISQDILTGTS